LILTKSETKNNLIAFMAHGVGAACCYTRSGVVSLSVCRSVCLSRSAALQKGMNWSRCPLDCGLGWAQGTMFCLGVQISPWEGIISL